MVDRRRVALTFALFVMIATVDVLSNRWAGNPINIREDVLRWIAETVVLMCFCSILTMVMRWRRKEIVAGEDTETMMPPDSAHEGAMHLAVRRLAAGVMQFVLHDGGRCLRCWLPFSLVTVHVSRITNNESAIALCQYCFETCTHEERLKYYGEMYGELVGKGMQPQLAQWQALVQCLEEEHHQLCGVHPHGKAA